MRNVKLSYFIKPVKRINVDSIVFKGKADESFDLGFLPGSEFIFHFGKAPDVFFKRLPIDELYYEPYRTIIKLRYSVSIEITSDPKHGKLYIKGI